MPTRHYVVTVTAETPELADEAMSQRLGHDEDYGFDYTLKCEPSDVIVLDADGQVISQVGLPVLELASLESESDEDVLDLYRQALETPYADVAERALNEMDHRGIAAATSKED